jgi:hypothetical protein
MNARSMRGVRSGIAKSNSTASCTRPMTAAAKATATAIATLLGARVSTISSGVGIDIQKAHPHEDTSSATTPVVREPIPNSGFGLRPSSHCSARPDSGTPPRDSWGRRGLWSRNFRESTLRYLEKVVGGTSGKGSAFARYSKKSLFVRFSTACSISSRLRVGRGESGAMPKSGRTPPCTMDV